MTFHFSQGCPNGQYGQYGQYRGVTQIEMCLEGTFGDGSVHQVIFARTRTGSRLLHRAGTTGSWLPSEGISFGELERTPENLLRLLGNGEPSSTVYCMPGL